MIWKDARRYLSLFSPDILLSSLIRQGPLIANSETEVESPNIVGPTPPKRNASDRPKRRLTFPDTGGDQDSFACFDRDLLQFNTPISADTPRVGFFASARASMARSVQVNSTAPAPGRTTRPVSSPAASNSPLPGLPLSTSTPSARSSCTSNSDHPVKSSSSHRSHSADSGVYNAPPDMATSLQQIIAQLQESNQEMKELTRQMKDIDKRVHSLDADHEGEVDQKKKGQRKEGAEPTVLPKMSRIGNCGSAAYITCTFTLIVV